MSSYLSLYLSFQLVSQQSSTHLDPANKQRSHVILPEVDGRSETICFASNTERYFLLPVHRGKDTKFK